MNTSLNNERKSVPILYIVIPCFNEEEGISKTAEVLQAKMNYLMNQKLIHSYSKVIFVDDGSKDSTWNLIDSFNHKNPSLFGGVKLAHNRGHQNALYAGLMYARKQGCDAAISMDSDLQDDVNAIDEMLKKFVEEHCEVVYGVRSSRKKDTWFKRNTALAFYKVFAAMGAEVVPNHADYRLMSASALDALSEYSEVNLFLRGIVPMLGFKTGKVYYERGVRTAGVSKYPLRKMISFALEGITSFSVKPLKLVTYMGLLSIVIGFAMFVYVIVSLFTNHTAVGWSSLMCSIWFIGGFLMISMGILGSYIGKIYLESKHRPRYYIEKSL
ncbi:glycosyltransferase [Bifidobacteriaceae bacterium NR021]|uniref:glycosyltransferase family 2 protein n=1 Tax=Gardnerella swidsinskii TaxID=2792979 RepID=UPI000E6A9097|nr:glycosyltransferase [Bifidobacteriaceae bacterium NR021]